MDAENEIHRSRWGIPRVCHQPTEFYLNWYLFREARVSVARIPDPDIGKFSHPVDDSLNCWNPPAARISEELNMR
jgi:hypothetical protein